VREFVVKKYELWQWRKQADIYVKMYWYNIKNLFLLKILFSANKYCSKMLQQTAKVMYTKLGLCRLIELKQEYAKNRDRYVVRKSEPVSKECVSSENVELLLKQDESNIKEAIYQVIF
jgi:hypothetical protein